MEGLTEGRIVHYVAYNNRHLASIIIGLNPGAEAEMPVKTDLAVFTSMRNIAGTRNGGLQFHFDIPYNDGKTPGTWHWIERT